MIFMLQTVVPELGRHAQDVLYDADYAVAFVVRPRNRPSQGPSDVALGARRHPPKEGGENKEVTHDIDRTVLVHVHVVELVVRVTLAAPPLIRA